MTYDLAVWEGERPDEANAAETFSALHDQYVGRDDPTPILPTPAIRAFDVQWNRLRPTADES
ncbi:hypothetical protein ACGGAQ_12830 [Micromonospora sp. NPDC047557]|uniref:hypothetical protein n=1 Tax=Micromonospora sp. NPDC047557 TaxID=3364250 RepID=UPI00371D92C6